jgi:hypothetical protein
MEAAGNSPPKDHQPNGAIQQEYQQVVKDLIPYKGRLPNLFLWAETVQKPAIIEFSIEEEAKEGGDYGNDISFMHDSFTF